MLSNTTGEISIAGTSAMHQHPIHHGSHITIPVEMHHQLSTLDATSYILVEEAEEPPSSNEDSITEFLSATSIDDFLWYNCPKCDYKCKTSPNFIEHVVQFHPKAKNVIEDLTNKVKRETIDKVDLLDEVSDFINSDLKDVSSHSDIEDDHDDAPSDEENIDAKNIKIEVEDLNNPQEYQCYYCGTMIVSIVKMKDHMREKHRRFHSKMYGKPRPFSCHSCGATFDNEKTKSNHMCTNVDFPVQKDESSGSFECKHCNKKFDRRKGYIYHVVNTHKAERNFACNECNYKAKNQMLLTRHVNRLHKQVKPYLCPHCGKAFYDSWNMKNHVKRLHLGEEIKKNLAAKPLEMLQCEHCGKDYSSPSALATHVKVQHEHVTYNCDRCGKMFRSKDWRDKHVLIVHEGQKPYVCDACGKAFGMKQGLKEHYIIVHEKNGKLKCDQCNFTAPNNSRLSFHIKTVHEKKATFNCSQCSFVCYRKDGLKAHVDAVHEKKRPHKCEYCDGAFFLRRDKERHLLKFHNIDVKKGGII